VIRLMGVPADRGAVDVVDVRGDLRGRQPAGGQRQHDLIDPVQAPLALRHDHRLERPVPIPRNLDLHRPDLGQHRLRASAVAHVRSKRPLAVLVPQVFRELGLKSGFEHRLGQPRQQPARTDQPDALLSGLLQQLLRQLLLIDDLARRHGLDHHSGFQLSRIRHGPFLSIGPNLTHRYRGSPRVCPPWGAVQP